MFAVAALAAVVVAAATPNPSLTDVANNAAFHLYVLPQPAEVDSVAVISADSQARPTSVKIVYRLGDRFTITVVETMRADDLGDVASPQPAAASPSPGPTGRTYIVNGYPATYILTGPYYQHVGVLTWLPPGVTVTLSSMDMTDAPTLINSALALY